MLLRDKWLSLDKLKESIHIYKKRKQKRIASSCREAAPIVSPKRNRIISLKGKLKISYLLRPCYKWEDRYLNCFWKYQFDEGKRRPQSWLTWLLRKRATDMNEYGIKCHHSSPCYCCYHDWNAFSNSQARWNSWFEILEASIVSQWYSIFAISILRIIRSWVAGWIR